VSSRNENNKTIILFLLRGYLHANSLSFCTALTTLSKIDSVSVDLVLPSTDLLLKMNVQEFQMDLIVSSARTTF
jgi:hypothetical protein